MHSLSTLVNARHRLSTYEKGEHGKPHLGWQRQQNFSDDTELTVFGESQTGRLFCSSMFQQQLKDASKMQGKKTTWKRQRKAWSAWPVVDTRIWWCNKVKLVGGGGLLQSFPVLAKKNKVPVVLHNGAECMRMYFYCISMSERRCGLLAFCCPPPPHYRVLL